MQRQVNIPVLTDKDKSSRSERQQTKTVGCPRQKTSRSGDIKGEGKAELQDKRANSHSKDNYDQVEMDIDSGAEDQDGGYIGNS